jgi:hypothetical protein
MVALVGASLRLRWVRCSKLAVVSPLRLLPGSD